MTTKQPKPPAPAKAQEKVTKPNGELGFWDAIGKVQEQISIKGYGDTSGKGGSYMKDSNLLKKEGNELLREFGITFVVDAGDDVRFHLMREHDFIIAGHYHHKWFYKGVLAHEGKVYASFNNTLGGRGESTAQVTTGAMTNATTIIMYDMLKANTQSEEDFMAKAEAARNAQEPRNPVEPKSNIYGR